MFPLAGFHHHLARRCGGPLAKRALPVAKDHEFSAIMWTFHDGILARHVAV